MKIRVASFAALLGLALGGPARGLVLRQGDLLVVDAGRSAAPAVPARVLRVSPATGAQQVVSSGGHLAEPFAIAIAPGGDLLVSDAGGGGAKLVRIDPANGAQSLVPNVEPLGLAVHGATGAVYASNGVGAAVASVDLATGATTPVASGPPIEFAQSLAVEPEGSVCVASFDGAWSLVRIDPGSGDATPLPPALDFVGGLAASPGSIWVTQPDLGSVVRVDTQANQAAPVSEGGDLFFPFGVAVEASGTLVVADWGDEANGAAIVRIDPTNGEQSLLASGEPLIEPWGIAVVAVPEASGTAGAVTALIALAAARRRSDAAAASR